MARIHIRDILYFESFDTEKERSTRIKQIKKLERIKRFRKKIKCLTINPRVGSSEDEAFIEFLEKANPVYTIYQGWCSANTEYMYMFTVGGFYLCVVDIFND